MSTTSKLFNANTRHFIQNLASDLSHESDNRGVDLKELEQQIVDVLMENKKILRKRKGLYMIDRSSKQLLLETLAA